MKSIALEKFNFVILFIFNELFIEQKDNVFVHTILFRNEKFKFLLSKNYIFYFKKDKYLYKN